MSVSPIHSITIGVVGGGAAGMSCSLWLKHLGFIPVIIERNSQLGGQLLGLDRVNRWVLGAMDKTSVELANIYASHIKDETIKILYRTTLQSVEYQPEGFDLVLNESGKPTSLSVGALVIATGIRVLGAEIFVDKPGFKALSEAGLIAFFPLDHLDQLAQCQGKTVAVIGGGDNAYFTALDLAQSGAKVVMLLRSAPKARQAVLRQVEAFAEQGLVVQCTGTQVVGFGCSQGRVSVTLTDKNNNKRQIEVDRVFVRAGFAANSEFLDAFGPFSGIAKEKGYIKTDANKRTAIPWAYAIGDVAHAKHQSVVGAIADGAIAAQDLAGRL
jgi:thioredoxin reductase (NADPH)